MPLIYVAWSDGELTGSEVSAICERSKRLAWLDDESRALLDRWLDPKAPPSPSDLHRLLERIRREAAVVPDGAARSLTELGLAMAHGRLADSGDFAVAAGSAHLEAIEAALGLVGPEAVRHLLERPTPELPAPPLAEIDPVALSEQLDGPYSALRRQVRAVLSDPPFRRELGMDRHRYRQQVLEWCRELARRGWGALGYPTEVGGSGDLGAMVAVFEELAHFDVSLMVKFGVQFGLFGGAIMNLGTAAHHALLPDVGRMAVTGCFAMTERGHGSNVRDLETVATYDAARDGFDLHTPSETARKEYIGNALHGRLAVVFAQLEVGGEGHGVHALIVPLRDEQGQPMPGISVEDSGEKQGLNGVDNGRIAFDHVFVPRAGLLDRFGTVTADGRYESPIPASSKRFFTMLGTLVGGRVSVAAGSVSVAKSALAIAVRHAGRRRQFGPANGAEVPVLDYLAVQRRLMPRLAQVYGLHFATRELTRRFLEAQGDADRRAVEGLAAAVKAYATWAANDIIQTCRECCGGAGYMAENRLSAFRADADVFTTFEGDNTVLYQLAARGLLSDFKASTADLGLRGIVRLVVGEAKGALTERNPIVVRLTDPDHLRGDELQLDLLRARERSLTISAARRIKKRIDAGEDGFAAANRCQDHLLSAARAFAERFALEQLVAGRDAAPDAERRALEPLVDLYALWAIEQDRGWFLEEGFLEGNKARAIRDQVNALCGEVRIGARELVDAFGIPEAILGAPIAIEGT